MNFWGQVTCTWNLATPGFFEPTLWFLQNLVSVIRKVSWPLFHWLEGQGFHAPPILRKEGGSGQAITDGTVGSTLSTGWLPPSQPLLVPQPAQQEQGTEITYISWDCVWGNKTLLFLVFSAVTPTRTCFPCSLSPNLKRQKGGDYILWHPPSGHGRQYNFRFKVLSFFPLLKMLITPLASCFQYWEVWYQLDSCSFVVSLPFSLEAVFDTLNFHYNMV